jgi:hypothetical protein
MTNLNIGFHSNSLTLRGAEVALYDYAFFNQGILKNTSVVFYKAKNQNDQSVINKFQKHFKTIPYNDIAELEILAKENNLDLMYFIKSGEKDANFLSNTPSVIHAVFPVAPSQLHGDQYAFVSEWLSKECSNGRIPFVPHMIHLPTCTGDLRGELGIVKDTTVLGCYGGADSFNLDFVKRTTLEALSLRDDLVFLFMNIAPYSQHPRLIFLPGCSDMEYKTKFINTCDGMLHGRGIGESFGIACGEFSVKGRPVLTYAFSPQRSHIEILGKKAILYKGKRDLKEILLNFNRSTKNQKNWDAYSDSFSPEKVMQRFDSVFINRKNHESMGTLDYLSVIKSRLIRKLRNLYKKMYL